MQFTLISSFALFAAVAIAQGSGANPFDIPSGGFQLTAGKPSTFKWKPTTSGSVTLTLRDGASSDLNKGTVIAQSISNSGSFTFTPPSSTVRNSDYTVEIASDSDPSAVNYTPQFVIDSSNTVESVSASASSSGASASSSASATSAAASSSASASSSSAASSASASSASASKSKSSSATTTGSSSAAATSSSTTTSAEKVPSSNAEVKNMVNGGLAAVAFGAALIL